MDMVKLTSKAVLLASAVMALPAPGSAQAGSGSNMAYVYIGELTTSFRDTPGGIGLLPIALREAQIAEAQGRLAARDTVSLVGIQRHASYALHAIDPTLVQGGPGRGYGVRRALPQIVELTELARTEGDGSEPLQMHAHHVATAARSAQAHADRAVEVAQQLLVAGSLQEGMRLARQLERWTRALASGIDTDGDGRMSWRPGEGGVDQAVWHMNLLKNAEGLN